MVEGRQREPRAGYRCLGLRFPASGSQPSGLSVQGTLDRLWWGEPERLLVIFLSDLVFRFVHTSNLPADRRGHF